MPLVSAIMFNQQNLLKILIIIVQLMSLMPFDFDFKKRQFQKSKYLYGYSVITSITYLILLFSLSIRWCLFYGQKLGMDFVTAICIILVGTLLFIQLIIVVYQNVFESSELMNILSEIKEFSKLVNYRKHKRSLYFVVILAVLDYIILPGLLSKVLYYQMAEKPLEYVLTLLILNYLNSWIMSSLLPIYIINVFFIIILKSLNSNISHLLQKLNSKNKNVAVTCYDIELMSNIYFNVVKKFQLINKFYKLNILTSLSIIIFIFIRKTYFLAFQLLWNPEESLESHIFPVRKVIEYILNLLMTTTLVILFLHGYQALNDENSKTHLLLRNIYNKNSLDQRIINAVI